MKATLDSISAALRIVQTIADQTRRAEIRLHCANTAFVFDATRGSIEELQRARDALSSLRRSQNAAIQNIDDAILTAKATLQLQGHAIIQETAR